MENGVLCTYDGLINQHGDIVFETSFLYTESTLDAVNNSLDYANIIEPNIDSKLREIGKCIVHEFGMRERFFHIEFFRLPDGEYIALEYNNRIAGGTCVDLYNYSYNISLYDIYVALNGEVEIFVLKTDYVSKIFEGALAVDKRYKKYLNKVNSINQSIKKSLEEITIDNLVEDILDENGKVKPGVK